MLIEGARMADVSNARESQQQHSRKGGGTTPPHDKCISVGERLYSQAHVCNHARCAANNPDYNVKTAIPPKKFLVAKKHAQGGSDEKGEKTSSATKSGSSTTSSDHHRDRRSHALQSLTNSVLTTENGKARPNGRRSSVHSVLPNRPARDVSSSDDKKVGERKGRPTTQTSTFSLSGSSRRSSMTGESHSTTQKSRLNNAISMPSPPTEERKQWEDAASPESTITSIRITQIISTRGGEEEHEEEKEGHIAASSPTASVGSNHDTEICGLKDGVESVEGGIVDQSTAIAGDLHSPATGSSSSSNLQQNPVKEETACDSPSPSVDSVWPDSSSFFPSPSTPSTSFASASPETSSVSIPASEITSSNLLQNFVGEAETISDSPTPVDSTNEPLTSSVTSTKSASHPSPESTGSSSRTLPPSTSPPASKLARKFISDLKVRSKIGSPVSSSSGASANRPSRIPRHPVSPPHIDSSPAPASANRPSRIPRRPVSPPPLDSSPAPTNASRVAKNFITDLQARTVARKASSKGVRSIELRGGKAQRYSTTTVTSSWDETTTTVETSVSVTESIPETNGKSEVLTSESLQVSIESPDSSSTKESLTAAAGPNVPAANPKAVKEVPATVKFVKNAKSFEEIHGETEKVSLKHGEVAERRLSEEYMTNHALEGVVKKISDQEHRVKVLVHAFESLAAISDSEVHASEDKALNPQLMYESLSATTITV